jgi:hypothetical protein
LRIYFLVVGSLILVWGFWLLYRRLALLTHSKLAKGVVTSYQVRESDGTKVYLPVVSFIADDSHTYEFTSVAGGNSRPHPEGHSVPVRYNPTRPNEAFIDSFLHFWAAPLACIVLGVAGVAVIFVR